MMYPEQENIFIYMWLKNPPSRNGGFLFLGKQIMKKNRKYIAIVFIAIIFLIGYLFFNREKEISLYVPYDANYSHEKIEPSSQISVPLKKDKVAIKKLDFKNIKISLFVLSKKYETEIKEGSSVFDAMKKIEEENIKVNIFNFKYTENPMLGSFVTEINGEKGIPGKYWIYYVNDKKASIGVSNYILKEGDIISWKQEEI